MAASRRGAGGVIKVIICVLLLLVLIAGLCFLAYFTNGFTGSFKTFYVQYGDKRILKDTEVVQIKLNVESRFECKYTFGFINRDTIKGYTVEIIPNTDKDFDFKLDGEVSSFAVEPDLSAAFDVQMYDEYFTLKLEKDLQGILEAIYPDRVVEVPGDIDMRDGYVVVQVKSFDGKAVVRLVLDIRRGVENVEIDPGEVVI